VTTREIPNERPKEEPAEPTDAEAEQPQTINPSLLSRSAAVSGPSVASRRSVFENAGARRMSIAVQEDPIRRLKPSRNVDVLHRALDMGKKIWSLNKLQRVLEILLESDPYRSFAMTRASHVGAANQNAAVSRAVEDPSLLQQMLDKERANGPTDRDLRVATQEIHYFKGHYIYVYDVEGKQKPMIIREFPKAAEKHDGDWPQLRASGSGRCPFVEDADAAEKRSVEKARRAAAAAAADKAPKLQPPEAPAPKPVTGKRTLGEMQDGQNQRAGPRARVDLFDATKAAMMPVMDFQNAFTGRAKTGRFFAGEPGASGVQPSGITSAIRSQMISSATGGLGARAGTSKAIHGLQRQVLQRSTSTGLQEPSSRRMTEVSMDHPNFVRSTSIGTTSRRKLDMIDEDQTAPEQKHKRTVSVPAPPPKKKREAKPGYCENCQEKFDDFDEVDIWPRPIPFLLDREMLTMVAHPLAQASQVCRRRQQLDRTRCAPGAARAGAQVPMTGTTQTPLVLRHLLYEPFSVFPGSGTSRLPLSKRNIFGAPAPRLPAPQIPESRR